jgi:hypothetical protein
MSTMGNQALHMSAPLEAITHFRSEAVATIQSLLVTCRFHDIGLYEYMVDVLQRLDDKPCGPICTARAADQQRCRAPFTFHESMPTGARGCGREHFVGDTFGDNP